MTFQAVSPEQALCGPQRETCWGRALASRQAALGPDSAMGFPLSALCPPSCPVLIQLCASPLSPGGTSCSFLPVLT